jgi:hypothetical protein
MVRPSPSKRNFLLGPFRRLFVAVVRSVKQDLALDHLFQSDPSGLMFGGIDIDAWARPALKLLAALGGQNDQTILGINLLRLRLFGRLVNLFVCFCHNMYADLRWSCPIDFSLSLVLLRCLESGYRPTRRAAMRFKPRSDKLRFVGQLPKICQRLLEPCFLPLKPGAFGVNHRRQLLRSAVDIIV